MMSCVADDRAVRDSERKAALMHYSSEQALQFAQQPQPQQQQQPARQVQIVSEPNPRVEQVQKLARPPLGNRKSKQL